MNPIHITMSVNGQVQQSILLNEEFKMTKAELVSALNSGEILTTISHGDGGGRVYRLGDFKQIGKVISQSPEDDLEIGEFACDGGEDNQIHFIPTPSQASTSDWFCNLPTEQQVEILDAAIFALTGDDGREYLDLSDDYAKELVDNLRDHLNPVSPPLDADGTQIHVGDTVIVPHPQPTDNWAYGDFLATVINIKKEEAGWLITVIDADDDVFQITPERLTVEGE
jgi:hypothetical protein